MSQQLAWFFAPAAASLLLAVAVGPVRRAYANGWHCLLRHDAIWKIPAAFVLAYGLFHIILAALLRWRTGQGIPDLYTSPPPELFALALELLPGALLPSAEMLGADLNCLVATFPISAVFGALFVVNWRGTGSELRRTLCKRFGFAGWLLFGALIVCALCALFKPGLFLFLPEIDRLVEPKAAQLTASAINALAFVFEYLLGTAVQVFLVLTAYGWMRGLHFPRQRLMHFAVRRLGFVIKWALVFVVATLAFIHLPLFVEVIFTGAPATLRVELFARPVILLIMLLFATAPIRLALHNDSLRGALAANLRFLRRHGLVVAAFLLAASGALVTLKSLEIAGLAWLDGTVAGLAWALFMQVIAAAAGGGILAAWVCFYTSLDGSSREVVF